LQITKIVVENYKVLRKIDLDLNEGLTIIVGDNEAGKTSLLEAIDLVLSGQLGGRSIANDLGPYLFNQALVAEYFSKLKKGDAVPPPHVLVEAYFSDVPELAAFRGTNNSLNRNLPGVSLRIDLNEAFQTDYDLYVAAPESPHAVPVEYYSVQWRSFANLPMIARSVPIKSLMVDTHASRTLTGADHYIARIINEVLSAKQRVGLSLSYRQLKTDFLKRGEIEEVNQYFADHQGEVSDKTLTVSVDISSRSTWETNLTPYLDSIPFANAGKGEQSSVKMKLALTAQAKAHVFLIEEPENHLSYPNMWRLIDKIHAAADGKQVVIATHSSFVLNKLGADKVVLFSQNKTLRLTGLPNETREYFMKLPGHDTLRLILARRAILVEGPSDELVIQRAYKDKYGKSPLERGVDVISVKSLAFKRFLDIAKLLGIQAKVVTDNDGDIEALKKRYEGYLDHILYDEDVGYPTLEPQLLKANSREILNKVLGKTFDDDKALLDFMTAPANKTDCALAIFQSPHSISYPKYIRDAIEE
jgi:predicted ATPase